MHDDESLILGVYNTWCLLRGPTYLNKVAGLFKYVWPFCGHQVLKGYQKYLRGPEILFNTFS